MAEFQEVMKQWDRMCNSMKMDCKDCKIGVEKNEKSLPCSKFMRKFPKEAEEIIMNWAKEHPAETWQSKLDKLLPNNHIRKHHQAICPSALFGDKAPGEKSVCISDCEKCWNSEVEENG